MKPVQHLAVNKFKRTWKDIFAMAYAFKLNSAKISLVPVTVKRFNTLSKDLHVEQSDRALPK